MRSNFITGVVAAAAIIVTNPFGVAGASAVTPSSMQSAAWKAASQSNTFRITSSAKEGAIGVDGTTDVGPSEGKQEFTITAGAATGSVSVVLLRDTAYIRGTAVALEAFMGFGTSGSIKYANKWLAVPHSDGDYSTVSAGLTVRSAISELKVAGTLSIVKSPSRLGSTTIGIKGTVSGDRATLYVQTSGKHLPVEEDEFQGTTTGVSKLGSWGERIDVSAPTNAIPISKTGLEQVSPSLS